MAVERYRDGNECGENKKIDTQDARRERHKRNEEKKRRQINSNTFFRLI